MAFDYMGSMATGIINGDMQDYQALAIFSNGPHSSKDVYIRRVVMLTDSAVAVASTVLFVPILTYRGLYSTAPPTLGDRVATAKKSPFKTSQTSDANIVMYYPATAGGIPDTVLAGTPVGGIVWRQWGARIRSAAEQQRGEDNSQLPSLIENYDFILHPGEYLIFRADPVTGSDNTPSIGWFLQVIWQEELRTPHYVADSVAGYSGDGSGITVNLFSSDDKVFRGTTVTAVGGGYSFTVYNTTQNYYTEAYQDGTHMGRSDVGVAT